MGWDEAIVLQHTEVIKALFLDGKISWWLPNSYGISLYLTFIITGSAWVLGGKKHCLENLHLNQTTSKHHIHDSFKECQNDSRWDAYKGLAMSNLKVAWDKILQRVREIF